MLFQIIIFKFIFTLTIYLKINFILYIYIYVTKCTFKYIQMIYNKLIYK